MMHDIVLEIIKAAIVGGAGAMLKMWADVRSLRSDLDVAFCKIRALEQRNGTGSPPCTKTPQ